MNVLASTPRWSLRCWKQATHLYFRTPAILPHVFTVPCRTFSRTMMHRPRSRIASSCSRPLSSQAASIPKSHATVLTSPTVKELEEGEVEVDLIPEDQIQLMLTDRAAEVRCPLLFSSESTHMSQKAIENNFHSGRQPRCGTPNFCRVWRVSWIPVQDGSCK